MVGVICALVFPTAAAAMDFGPLEGDSSITDASVRANALVSADFNGDGLDDIAAGLQNYGVQIRLANADGSWTTVNSSVPDKPGTYSLATGDFNDDGKADLVKTEYACSTYPAPDPECAPQGSPVVLLGNGDGTFGAPININSNLNSPAAFNAISVGDADSDGNLDVIVGMGLGEYGIAYGNGNGGFTLAQRTQIPGAPHGYTDDVISNAVGDFNGDGENDLALAIRNHNDLAQSAIYLLLGTGTRGTFDASANNPFAVGQPAGYIDSIKAADFNLDGNDDLAASMSTSDAPPARGDGSIQFWQGDGDDGLVFNSAATIVVASSNPSAPNPDQVGPSNLQVGDYDNDGFPDAAWFEYFIPNGPPEYRLNIARGEGDGQFTLSGGPWAFPDGAGDPKGFVAGDFNGDGGPDFAFSSWQATGGLFILQSQIDLSHTPDEIGFGNVRLNDPVATRQFSILNSAAPAATINQVTLTGPNAAKFQLPAQCAGQVINSRGGCQQDVKFTPDAVGSHSATVHVTFAGTDETMDIPLAANVVVPRASFDPAELDFGEVRINQGLNQTVTVTSTGDLPLYFDGLASISGPNANDFAFTSNTCTGETIDPGETCQIKLNGIPSAVGTRTAQLNLPNDGYQSAQTVALSVEGVNPGMLVAPGSNDFGDVFEGETASQDFTIQSAGTTPLRITDVSMIGTRADDFSITTNNCMADPLPVGQTCQIQVTFAPGTSDDGVDRDATLRIQAEHFTVPRDVEVSGTALKAEASFNPGQLDFGEVPVGSSATLSVQVTSEGDPPLHVEEAWVDGPDGQEFSLSNDTCSGSSVEAGCSYEVTFTPDSRGDKEAYTGVWGSNIDEDMPVTGKGIQPAGNFDLGSLDFGNAMIGAPSGQPTETFKLLSTGADPLTIDSVSIAGADADSFEITSNGCGATLASNQSCPVEVTFNPRTGKSGKRLATLSASTNAGTFESSISGLAVPAPSPTHKAKLKLTGPKKVKAGKKFKLKAMVTNTGTGDLTGLSLKWKATQGKKVKKKGKTKLANLATGKKLTKRLVIAIKKKKLTRGKPLKVTITLLRQGKILTTRKLNVRQEFGPANSNKR
jgi:hypothetical protein